MPKIFAKTARIGVITEPLARLSEPTLEEIGVQLKDQIGLRFGASLAIREVDAGSCNSCEFGVSYASCGAVANVIPADAARPDARHPRGHRQARLTAAPAMPRAGLARPGACCILPRRP